MRKAFLFLLFIISMLKTHSQDSLILKAINNTGNLKVYSDANGINGIGEIEKGRTIFLLAPGGMFYYYVYGGGLVGYASASLLEFESWNANKLTSKNIDWKIEEAKRLDVGAEIEKKNNRIKDSITERESLKKLLVKGVKDEIEVIGFSLTGNEYKVGFDITVVNFRKTEIKYVRITVNGYNDVNDLEATKTFKCVGPIGYLDSGEYAFDDAFYSRVITSLKITKLSIDYMDGSHREFVGSEVKKRLTYLTLE